MSDQLLTKRLHISGITPKIRQVDLERLLSSFGRVKAMDGFGAQNALGDPRKFVFVTMEIDAKSLKKCLNALSGSTWKGAKLRIGEAKPDFRERLARVNSQPPRPIRPKLTRARNYGYPSPSLPLNPLSSAAAASTPGWIVTPSGRVVRPMRMRPERPLEPTRTELSASNVHRVNGKVKNRIKPPPVRARRRLIDPTNWDSVYIKGVFLDAVSVPLPASKESFSGMKRDTVSEEEEEEEEEEDITDISSRPSQRVPQSNQNRAHTIPGPQTSQGAYIPNCSQSYETAEPIDVRGEVNTALAMLKNIFGDRQDWEERASAEEMERFEGFEARKTEMQVDEEGDIEIVPRDFGESERSEITKAEKGKEIIDEETQATRYGDVDMGNVGPPVNAEVSTGTMDSSKTNLKTLFMPREEASFSLLDHLDLELDLELDANIFGNGIPTGGSQENSHLPEPILQEPHRARIPATTSNTKVQSRLTLDTSLPLLFPLVDMLPYPQTPFSTAITHRNGTPSCFLFSSATRVPVSHHLPPSITFTRTPQDTSESIREMWERDKSSLTHDWKKAWREARGSRKGKGGAEGEVAGGY